MNATLLAACALLTVAVFGYVFWPERNLARQRQKTRLDFLLERKEQVYENLRDLNFEFRAGKYPAEDYAAQRSLLESEAAALLAEIDRLEAIVAAFGPAAEPGHGQAPWASPRP